MSGSTLSDMWQSWLQIIATYETNVWWIQLGPLLDGRALEAIDDIGPVKQQ